MTDLTQSQPETSSNHSQRLPDGHCVTEAKELETIYVKAMTQFTSFPLIVTLALFSQIYNCEPYIIGMLWFDVKGKAVTKLLSPFVFLLDPIPQ